MEVIAWIIACLLFLAAGWVFGATVERNRLMAKVDAYRRMAQETNAEMKRFWNG